MKISYRYKDKVFDNLNDIVDNNKLKLDLDFIYEEYLPFQIAITGRTFLKGVTLESNIKYNSLSKPDRFTRADFSNGIEDYLDEYGYYDAKLPIAAVSGGVDSSVVALELEPSYIFSGYYDVEECDERQYSRLIAEKINASHMMIELKEDDYLDSLEPFVNSLKSPIAGFGGLAFYILLEKVLKEISADVVVFGNGGDEIFSGYYYHYLLEWFLQWGYEKSKYMSNFDPYRISVVENSIDPMIISALNRGTKSVMTSSFVASEVYPRLWAKNSIMDKFLMVNIDWVLVSLLHLYKQLCNFYNVKDLHPLSNRLFIENAKSINTPFQEIPKWRLRTARTDLPDIIKHNYAKQGFPVPLHKWARFSKMVKDIYESHEKRGLYKLPSYSSLNRFSWGVAQIELFMRNYGY